MKTVLEIFGVIVGGILTLISYRIVKFLLTIALLVGVTYYASSPEKQSEQRKVLNSVNDHKAFYFDIVTTLTRSVDYNPTSDNFMDLDSVKFDSLTRKFREEHKEELEEVNSEMENK